MKTYTQPLSRELDRAVYMTERYPHSLLWRAWRRLVEWWIFGGRP